MRIFIAHEDPWRAGNPYIYTLMETIQGNYPDVVFGWGWNPFWSDMIFAYDAVHFQWPQAYFSHLQKERAAQLVENRIKELKQNGIKIFATCHDLKPHYSQCADYAECMLVVYRNADVIFHLGEYSKQLFEHVYPDAKNVILEHHVFDTVYTNKPTREDSLNYLKLDSSKRYILCFGMFRSDVERNLVIELSKRLSDKSLVFLAPAFMKVRHRKGWKRIVPTLSQIKQYKYKKRYNILMTGGDWVPVDDESLPYYYGVADMAFIQRVNILNSGNAILPMLFDKVVVGPAVGNVKTYLEEKGYPMFEGSNLDSVVEAFKKGMQLSQTDFAEKARGKYFSALSTESMAHKLYTYYKEVL